MNIIFVRKKSGTAVDINLSAPFIIMLFLSFLSLPVLTYYFGAQSGTQILVDNYQQQKIEPLREELNQVIGSVYKDELARQQEELDALKQHNQENINALTNSMAKLQAHIFRLDALGSRLTDVAQLDKKAFNFDFSPSMGGPDDNRNTVQSGDSQHLIFSQNLEYGEFVKRMEQITEDIESRSRQLEILENLLITQRFNKTITPSGKPAEKGWISSYFGMRKDPFTGKRKMHKGVDVAGKSGASVVATADGVVIRAEAQNGYGKLLEIDHGYGLSTRYGHNKSISVKVGDIVKQGQKIGTMGSTGRSTGPHVHYEVLRNGKVVNPQKYIITAQGKSSSALF